jgi:hypothetical protein
MQMRTIQRLVVLLSVSLSPVVTTAQVDPPAAPENAHARRYGDGWANRRCVASRWRCPRTDTSPLIAARFVQVENVIGKLIDLQIAAELPLME